MGYDLATRAQVLALKANKASTLVIEDHTGLPSSTIRRIINRARSRRFNPKSRPCRILNFHVADARRSDFATSIFNTASSDSGYRRSPGPWLANGQGDPAHQTSSEDSDSSSTSSDAGDVDASAGSSASPTSLISGTPPPSSPPPPPPAVPPRQHPTRFLQVRAAMSPLFQSLSGSTLFAVVIRTGDFLLRDDAVSFLRNDLPLWEGIWDRKRTTRPAAHEPNLEQVVKISRCVSLLETRSSRDHVRLRFHKLLQYQAFARLLAEEEATRAARARGTSTIDRIMQKIHGRRWSLASAVEKKKLKNTFHAQKRAGKRLQTFCNHVGYGFLLLGSRTAVGKMLEPTFTDEMFHALVCYVCNMFPRLRMVCDRLDKVVRHLVQDDSVIGMGSQLSSSAAELEAFFEDRDSVIPPANFILIDLSDEVNSLDLS